MRVIVPFAAERPKTRLAPVLSRAERATFASAMLGDVLEAVLETGRAPTVLTTAPLDGDSLETDAGDLLAEPEVSVVVDDRSLTAAVNARLPETTGEAVAVAMADLALATPAALERLFSREGDVVVAPGRGGGTNAITVRHPDFRVDYHGCSFLDHRAIAREVGAAFETVDSYRLGVDVDEPSDLTEVLVHGDGRAAARLRAFGFALEEREGRVATARTDE